MGFDGWATERECDPLQDILEYKALVLLQTGFHPVSQAAITRLADEMRDEMEQGE